MAAAAPVTNESPTTPPQRHPHTPHISLCNSAIPALPASKARHGCAHCLRALPWSLERSPNACDRLRGPGSKVNHGVL